MYIIHMCMCVSFGIAHYSWEDAVINIQNVEYWQIWVEGMKHNFGLQIILVSLVSCVGGKFSL